MDVRYRVIAVLVATTLAAAGCAGTGSEESVPGVTATTVTIGSHQPLTGPTSPGFSERALAAKAYFNYVNDHGGVNGRKIIFNYKDDSFNPTNTIRVIHKLVEEDRVFAIFDGFGTPTHQAVVDYLNDRKVPDLFPDSGCVCWNSPATHPYTFGWRPDYLREGKVLGSYIERAFPGKRVAYFSENDESGQDAARGLDKVIPAGLVVSRQTFQPTYTDLTAQMRAIARAKADVIVSFAGPAYTALLRRAQQRLGNTAKLVVYFGDSDPAILSRLLGSTGSTGADNALVQGIITDAYMPSISDTSNSWIALMKMIHDKYALNLPLDQHVEYGIAVAYTLVQALQQAGRHLTRASLITAVERGGLRPGFGLTPFGYSHSSHGGYTGFRIGTIRGHDVVLQGHPLTTDDRDGPVVPYTRPQAAAPTNGIPSS